MMMAMAQAQVKGRAKLGVAAFAESLLVIPKTLAQNRYKRHLSLSLPLSLSLVLYLTRWIVCMTAALISKIR